MTTAIDNAMTELDDRQARELAAIEAGREREESDVEFYARISAQLEFDRQEIERRRKWYLDVVNKNCDKMLRDIDARQNGLNWKYLPTVESEIIRDTANKKSRHIKTPWGMVGFRKQAAKSTLVIEDQQRVIDACLETLPGAVVTETKTRLDRSVIKDVLANGGRIDGCRLDEIGEYDKFYFQASVSTPELEADSE